ncbi:unnamed protein product [Effrenium voratum]|nr:unnamed protein product [Effrenium voratum]
MRWAVFHVALSLPALADRPAQSGALLQRSAGSEKAVSLGTQCGMGTPGFCLGSTDWQSQLAAVAPGASANFFNTFMKVWDDVTPLIGFVFCLGDRPGSWVVSDTYGSSSQLYDSYQGLTYLRNLFIASEDAEEWGTVGLYMTLPCPSADDPTAFTELKTGFAFNKCDSGVNFMLSISPNTMACYAEKFSPPVGKLVAMMPEFSFGISVDRKLSRTVLLAHGDGDNIHVSSVTLKAHLGVSVRARISLGKLLSLENAVGDLLAGDLQLQVAAGFDVEEEVKDALTWLTTSDLTNSLPDLVGGVASAYYLTPLGAAVALEHAGAATPVVNLVRALCHATFMIQVTGYISLLLRSATGGILPNLSFQLFQANMMLRTGPGNGQDDAESHLPGLYFFLSADLGNLVESIVQSVLGEIGGFLDVIGVDTDSGISLSAGGGIGFFINTAGVGFYSEVKVGGSATTVRCIFKFANSKLRCKARLGWAEIFAQAGKFVINKIDDFAGHGAQEIAEFYQDQVGANGAKFAKAVVNQGKKVVDRAKCKLSNLLGGKCKKSGGNPSSCGDGTEYVIKNDKSQCLQISPDCYQLDSEGKVYFYRVDCKPAFADCTHYSSSYSEQMKSFWWFTKERYLCNEYMHNMYFADISDPDSNPKCIKQSGTNLNFVSPSQSPSKHDINKKSTERFRIAFQGVSGPYGQVCLQSSEAGPAFDRRRRRNFQNVFVRGYQGGRRRRRCDKNAAKSFRIYQKLEPGNGQNYEKENGDSQFNSGCS